MDRYNQTSEHKVRILNAASTITESMKVTESKFGSVSDGASVQESVSYVRNTLFDLRLSEYKGASNKKKLSLNDPDHIERVYRVYACIWHIKTVLIGMLSDEFCGHDKNLRELCASTELLWKEIHNRYDITHDDQNEESELLVVNNNRIAVWDASGEVTLGKPFCIAVGDVYERERGK